MITRFCVGMILVCGTSVMVVNVASANGKSAPRIRDGEVIRASCVERAGERTHEILRTRLVAAGKTIDLLTLRIGDAREQVTLGNIKSVSLPDAAVDRDGFTRATLVRRDDTSVNSVAVQVRLENSALSLRGFNSSGSGVSIEIAKCRAIEFSTIAKSAAEDIQSLTEEDIQSLMEAAKNATKK